MEIVTYRVVTRGIDKPYVEIPKGVTHIGDEAFSNMSIEHVILPSTLIKIDKGAFSSCTKLLSVDFSRCTELEEIGENAFSGCVNLRHVHLGNCVRLPALAAGVFKDCNKLVLHVPRNVTGYFEHCVQNVALVALPAFAINACSSNAMLLPKDEFQDQVSGILNRYFVDSFFTEEYDKYADVFDAIGQLNVLWVESLRRQGKIRETNGWSKAVIVEEAETKNRVLELWARMEPFDIYNEDEEQFLFQLATDLLIQGERLVNMTSYQNQPEETKLFKTILDSFSIQEPARAPSADVRSSKRARRLMAKLRL